MKFENAFSFILDINERFRKCNKETKQDMYFEILHSSLTAFISELTEEQYNKFQKPFRETVEKLEREILNCCSKTYCEDYKEYLEENGRFKVNEENTGFLTDHDRFSQDELVDDEDDEEHYNNDEDDDTYELKWIDNPSYKPNLIL